MPDFKELDLHVQARASDAGFLHLFEHAEVGVLLAGSGVHFIDANPAACRMLGYSRDELSGLDLSDIVVQAAARDIAPALTATGSATHCQEQRFRRKDGSVFAVDVTSIGLADGARLSIFGEIGRVQTSRELLAAIVDSSSDAIVGNDLDGIVGSWNAAAENIFGYRADEIVGTSIDRLIPDDRRGEEDIILDKLRRGERVDHFETVRRTKEGRLVDVSIAVSPIRDDRGRIAGASKIVRDITALTKRTRDVERISRLYASLSEINQAIVLTPSREVLFTRVCEALVDKGAFSVAWVSWFDPQTARLVPVAVAGDHSGYVQSIEVYGEDRAQGRGPSGKAFRDGEPRISQDFSTDPDMQPWLAEATRRGFRSSAALPIRVAGKVCGVLAVNADETDFFQEAEMALLKEAASDISIGLDASAREDERRRVEAIARSERAFSDTIIESMAGVLYLYDEHGQFLRWNRDFEIVTGYAAHEIERMHPAEFFSDQDRPLLTTKIKEVFEKGESSIEAPLLAKNGKSTPYYLTGRRIVFEGRTCLIGVGIDISERKRAEEALRELNEGLERKVTERTVDLQTALARARAADQTKSAFLATMSHELRTPLNSIIGFSGIVLQGLAGELNPEQKKQLGMVRGSARHLLALINDVLDISKIEAGELEVSFKAFDIAASIERIVASIMPMAEKKGLALSADLGDLPREFISDQRRVEQMLLNLLSNAVKFTEQGSVKLSATIAPGIAGQDGPALLVRVADTGIGIQAEHLPKIFQAFRQIDTGISRQHDGTGLGLAISRRLAERLGGGIQVESEFGRGSVFTLVLPFKGGV
ncbi:MAG: PAS domain S-box protein [Bradyrhizobium sp.]|uniref:PAS domain S-box protein n=1 Tax=Bradyrhizobium sp. TaxID=376 RepID=UPI00271AD918|nr:PAS domain S-box protein [Bradyrhizobium sp.]MDO8397941.1 PAS domain S-box protein [Bradyrhizobium sp.]